MPLAKLQLRTFARRDAAFLLNTAFRNAVWPRKNAYLLIWINFSADFRASPLFWRDCLPVMMRFAMFAKITRLQRPRSPNWSDSKVHRNYERIAEYRQIILELAGEIAKAIESAKRTQ